MKKSLFILYIVLLCDSSCRNAVERNQISFKDKINSIEIALIKMEGLIKKLPYNDDFNINYQIKGDSIEVNGAPGRGDSVNYYTNNALSVLKVDERKQFIDLAKYLKRNNISAGYLYRHSSLCLFTYRESPEKRFDDLREITFLKETNNSIIKEEYKIIDKQDKIILIAPKEARM